MKKFICVITEKGEILLAYKSDTMNIFYYRPGSMLFIAMHASTCDCNMCEWVIKPPAPSAPRRTPTRQVPYGQGRRTRNNIDRPRTTTPRARTPIIERSVTPDTNTRRSPPAQNDRWDSTPDTCNWNDDPFNNEEARELDHPTYTRQNVAYWKGLHYQAIQRIAKMDDLKLKICPGIPTHNHFSTIVNAKNAYLKVKRAEELLTEALNGQTSYSSAHREWNFYRKQCEHGTRLYSPSTECLNCTIHETTLDETYKDGWTHIKQEGTA
jgi:hypothetical protein